MGYDTSFDGVFKLDRPLTPEHAAYLHAFADTRRMKRDVAITAKMPDPVREAVGLGLGKEGGYFVGACNDNNCGQSHSADILDYNEPPAGQPGLWCKWEPVELDADGIAWNGAEKFSAYTAWLTYLIAHFLGPWGYKLNGEVETA